VAVPQGAIALGDWYYLFQSRTNPTDCLISAHGGYEKVHNTLAMRPGFKVHFYTQHDQTLADPGLALMYLNQPPTDTYEHGDDKVFVNYMLSKYQGTHSNANETYESIYRKISQEDGFIARYQHEAVHGATPMRRQIAAGQLPLHKSMSVLTIRNRSSLLAFKAPPELTTLKNAMDAAIRAMPTLRVFHCSFCRSLIT